MLSSASRELNNLMKNYSSAARGATILMSIYGICSVAMYIRREGMPLPPFDAGLIPLAILTSIIFFVFISILFVLFVIPTFPAFIASGQFARRFHSMIQEGERLSIKKAICDYLWVYAPFLGLCASVPFVSVRGNDTSMAYVLIFAGFALSALECWYREGNLKNTSLMIWNVLLANLAAAFWFLTIATSIVLPTIVEKFSGVEVSDSKAVTIIAAMAMASAGVHFILAISGKNIPYIVFLFIVYLFLILQWPGASYLGGTALSMLGYGGRLPVTIELAGGHPSLPLKTLNGCMILNTSSVFYFMETDNIDNCKIKRIENWQKFMFQTAIYKRNDVVKILEYSSRLHEK